MWACGRFGNGNSSTENLSLTWGSFAFILFYALIFSLPHCCSILWYIQYVSYFILYIFLQSWKVEAVVPGLFVKNGYKSNNKDQYFCHVATAQCFPERYIYIYGVMSHFQHFSFLVYGVLFQHSFCCSGCPCGIEVTPCVSASYLWEIKCSS